MTSRDFLYRIQVIVMDTVTRNIMINKIVYDFPLYRLPSVIFRAKVPRRFSTYNPLLLTVYDHTIYNNREAQPVLKLHVDLTPYVKKTGNISAMEKAYLPLNFHYTDTPITENKKIDLELPPTEHIILVTNFNRMEY